jgi:predicted nuclease with TOPRIM domain
MKKKHLKRDIKELQKRIKILNMERSAIENNYKQLYEAVGKMAQALRAEHPNEKQHLKMMLRQRREWPELWDWVNIVADIHSDQEAFDWY